VYGQQLPEVVCRCFRTFRLLLIVPVTRALRCLVVGWHRWPQHYRHASHYMKPGNWMTDCSLSVKNSSSTMMKTASLRNMSFTDRLGPEPPSASSIITKRLFSLRLSLSLLSSSSGVVVISVQGYVIVVVQLFTSFIVCDFIKWSFGVIISYCCLCHNSCTIVLILWALWSVFTMYVLSTVVSVMFLHAKCLSLIDSSFDNHTNLKMH